MHYVYLIRSISHPYQTYVGLTDHVENRLKKHNEGGSPHTAKYKPWTLVSYQAFSSRKQAAYFEAYLKSGSGRAFVKRRLWQSSRPPSHRPRKTDQEMGPRQETGAGI